jgi:diguanylate cyclase (GGDEF)-like protein/PAS domain S-box-containing protein
MTSSVKISEDAIVSASQLLDNLDAASLQKIVAACSDGIVIVDEPGTILFVNQAVEELFSHSEEDLIGQPFRYPLVTGDTSEIDIVQKGGRSRSVKMQVVSLDWNGQPAFLALLRDITEHKQMEDQLATYRASLEKMVAERADALLQSNVQLQQEIQERTLTEYETFTEKERLQITLDSIADAVLVTDDTGNIRQVNPVAAAMLGKEATDVIDKPVTDVLLIVDENTREKLPNPVEVCLKKGLVATIGEHALLTSADGSEYAIQDSVAPIRDHEGRIIGSVLVFRDVTAAREIEKTIEYQAAHDALTGLVNRREFELRLKHALKGSEQYGSLHTLCYLDLDQFKVVNDTAGHQAGDEILRQVTGLLSQQIRERDTLARLGGDEFGILLDNCQVSKAKEISNNIISSLRDSRFEWDGRVYKIGVSIGIVPLSGGTKDHAQLMMQADAACYSAKELGRNRFNVYAANGEGSTSRHVELHRATELREALNNNQFQLWMQSIRPLRQDGDLPCLYEILLRLVDDDGNIRHPGSFMPDAERYNVIHDIDRWVIASVLENFQLFAGEDNNCVITINLSGNSLSDKGLLNYLHHTLDETQVNTSQVCFEITETAAIQYLSQAQHLSHALRERGCQLALGDFGSGLSSFSYLKRLPIDYLKISGNFVEGMLNDKVDHAFVESINHIGHTIKVKIIAEHVEHDELVKSLRKLGVDYIQGYAVGRPEYIDLSGIS